MESQILLYLNSLSTPWLDNVMLVVTRLGGVAAVLLAAFFMLAVLYRLRRWQSLAVVAVGMTGTLVLMSGLKLLFARQRPELWELLTHESTYSFPSGHAAMSSVLAICVVMLAWRSRWRWLVAGIAVLYVLAIGFSRMYLGVHYPTDILAGWTVAVLWMLVTVRATGLVGARRRLRR